MNERAACAAHLVITVPDGPERLALLTPHPGLDTFRQPAAQLAALVAIASEPLGCVATATLPAAEPESTADGMVEAAGAQPDADLAPSGPHAAEQLVGYAAFHRPSAVESWGEDRTGAILELGAVEVAPGMRGLHLAERLLQASFADGRFDDTVVFATLYRWHYDLDRTGLGELGYRRMLERLYATVGLLPVATTDAEVMSDHANRLVARVGRAAPPAVVAEFERLRLRRW